MHIYASVYLSEIRKHIIDIRGMSVVECPGDSLDLRPLQEDCNITKMSCER